MLFSDLIPLAIDVESQVLALANEASNLHNLTKSVNSASLELQSSQEAYDHQLSLAHLGLVHAGDCIYEAGLRSHEFEMAISWSEIERLITQKITGLAGEGIIKENFSFTYNKDHPLVLVPEEDTKNYPSVKFGKDQVGAQIRGLLKTLFIEEEILVNFVLCFSCVNEPNSYLKNGDFIVVARLPAYLSKVDGTPFITTPPGFYTMIRDAFSQVIEDSLSTFRITEGTLACMKSEEAPDDLLEVLQNLKDQEVNEKNKFLDLLVGTLGEETTVKFQSLILKYAQRPLAFHLQSLNDFGEQVWPSTNPGLTVKSNHQVTTRPLSYLVRPLHLSIFGRLSSVTVYKYPPIVKLKVPPSPPQLRPANDPPVQFSSVQLSKASPIAICIGTKMLGDTLLTEIKRWAENQLNEQEPADFSWSLIPDGDKSYFEFTFALKRVLEIHFEYCAEPDIDFFPFPPRYVCNRWEVIDKKISQNITVKGIVSIIEDSLAFTFSFSKPSISKEYKRKFPVNSKLKLQSCTLDSEFFIVTAMI